MRSAMFVLLAVAALPVAAQPKCVDPARHDGLGGRGSDRVTTAYNFTSGSMVVLGAAGGAGYAKRPQSYERPRWEIVVRMDTGGNRTLSQAYEPALRVGDRVRVLGTQVELAD